MGRTNFSQEQLALLSRHMKEGNDLSLSIQPAVRILGDEVLPLSYTQQQLWFLDQLQRNSPAYNIALAYSIKGDINSAALERSVNEIIRRHEVLRAAFKTVDGQPMLAITADLPLKLSVKDLAGIPDEHREDEMRRLAIAEARKPFDLAIGPLLRVRLLRLRRSDHVLLLTFHHIVFDGWSIGIFSQELATLYHAYIQGEPSPLPELPIQYTDYAAWQRERLQGEVLESELDYWKQQLANVPVVLDLPRDRPRPAIQTYQGGLHTFKLPEELFHTLKALSRQESCTLFQMLLAAFQVLLYRYTGQHDIVVGSPVANRSHVEVEKLIGFFANTLVLRSDLSGNPTFRELLDRVRDMTLDAYAHQEMPFEKLVDELQPRRDLSYAPLTQVLFALQNASDADLKLTNLDVFPLEINNETTKFDISLELVHREDRLTGSIQYSVDLFDAATVARMTTHFQILLEGLVANLECHISDLPLLTASECQTLLSDWSTTEAEYDYQQCLHQLVEQQVQRTPTATALVCEETSLSYRTLNERANQLAHALQELGIVSEQLIGVCLPRSLEMVIGLLAILKVGGVCVPLDPEYPSARLAFMLQDAQVSVLLTQHALLAHLPTTPAHVLCLDTDGPTIAHHSRENLACVLSAEQPASVVYTSGSTGMPKGVLLRHSSLCNRLLWGQQAHPLTAQDRVLQEASFSFDFAIWELFAPLSVGAQVILARPGGQRDVEYLVDLIGRHSITIAHLIPSLLRVFLEQANLEEHCKSLRQVYAGAEPLPRELWRRFSQRLAAQLLNVYGPTEASIDTTCWTCEAEERTSMLPIGRPVGHAQVYLLDAFAHPVPLGAAGEIYLGGAGLARGYLNRPELTAERFLPHPWSQEPGARLYRTGDVGRYRADGVLEYIGRVDTQVKVRGFRIELGEIEAVLKEHEGVRDAAVGVDESEGEKRLVAYLVTEREGDPTSREVRRFLQQRLPEYMLPGRFVRIEELPLGPNGKLDRRQLPTLQEGERPELAEMYVAPETEAERTLVEIWSKVLRVEQVGIHDNFFELGGDSIRSVQIVARAKASGLSFSVQHLFQHQTIAELIENIGLSQINLEALPRTRPFDLISTADRRKLPLDIEDAYPFTAMQKGMLYHMDLTKDLPGASDYHNVDSFYYSVPFNAATFQQAVDRCVQHHPALRTSFDLTSYSEPLQLVHKSAKLLVKVEDIRQYNPTEQEQIIREFVKWERTNQFDMSKTVLLRFYIHHRTDDSFQLTFTEYHPIIDGWSIHSILAEIFTTYLRMLDGTDQENEEPIATSFRDYVAAEAMSIQSEANQKYWESKLANYNRLELPTWTPSASLFEDERYGKITVSIPLDISEKLRQIAHVNNLSLKSVLFAIHVKVMSFLSGQTDILTGQLSNGRLEVVDGERVVGLFLNILPLRLQANGGSWLDLMHQVFDAESEVLPYRRYPLAELQAKWGGRTPLLNTVFSYFDFHVFNDMFDAGKIKYLGLKIVSHNVGFVLNALFFASAPGRKSNQIYFDLAYEAARLNKQEAINVGEYYISVMKAMLSDPQAHYEHANVLPASESQTLLSDWATTEAGYDYQQCLHQLVEQQVQRTPTATALVCEETSLSYRTLNEQANQLAHALQEQGIVSEQLIGVCLPRSLEMVISLLAILKVGGVCVPLDPEYPSARLAFMLQDAQVSVLLTQHALLAHLPTSPAHVLCLDTDGPTIAHHSRENLACVLSAEQPASVVYTSGSTGMPKGVLLRHSSLCNRLLWGQQAHPLTAQDRVLQEASFSFDFAIWELFAPLSVGAQVILARPGGQRDVEYLVDLIGRHSITIAHLIPSLLRVFLEQANLEEHCKSLRQVYAGAEPLPRELWQRFSQRLAAQLLNVYGPTEASIDTTCWTCEAEERTSMLPIGRPVGHAQVYLLDAFAHPVPLGAAGEIYLGGAGLARGYLNRPELTAERFLPHPWSQEPGARLYRTGDVGRYRADGVLEYIGRVDTQVKVRGFRIELGEIEVVLKEHEGVRDAAVGVDESEGEKRLVAYLVTEQEGDPTSREVRRFLQQRLPEYMLPGRVVRIEKLPLGPNGKLDRRQLPALQEGERPELAETYVAPETEAERTLVEIWSKVLRVEQVGIHDNFFELGGNSLLCIHISAYASQKGLRVSINHILEHQTIAELAKVVGNTSSIIEAEQAPVIGELPFTSGQRWLLEELQASVPRYWNMIFLFDVQQSLDLPILQQAMQYLLLHHDILRLRIRQEEAGWRQFIPAPGEPLPIEWKDLSRLPDAERDNSIAATAAELQTRINQLEGSLLCVAYFDMGVQRPGRMLWVINHLITDNLSNQMLFQDFQTVCQQIAQDKKVCLPLKTTSFKYWAQLLEEYVQSTELKQELEDYWLRLPWDMVQPLPVDYPVGRTIDTVASSRTVTKSLTVQETKALFNHLLDRHTQIMDVLLTALTVSLATWSGSPVQYIAVLDHGRQTVFDNVNLSRTAGFIAAGRLLLLELDEIATPATALQAIKKQLHSIAHNGIGLNLASSLSNDVALRKQLQIIPPQEVDFNYTGQEGLNALESSFLRASQESLEPARNPEERRHRLLRCFSSVSEDQLCITWEYSENIHKRSTITSLAQEYISILRTLIVDSQVEHDRITSEASLEDGTEQGVDETGIFHRLVPALRKSKSKESDKQEKGWKQKNKHMDSEGETERAVNEEILMGTENSSSIKRLLKRLRG